MPMASCTRETGTPSISARVRSTSARICGVAVLNRLKAMAMPGARFAAASTCGVALDVGQHHGADGGRDQQRAGEIERQQIAGEEHLGDRLDVAGLPALHAREAGDGERSEERRVGKECRSRWSPYH